MLKLQCLTKLTLLPILTLVLTLDYYCLIFFFIFIFSVVKMGKKKVSYSSNWDADFKWLRSTNDPSAAFYTVCSKKFCIDNVRKSQVEFPEHGMFHIKHVNAQKGQRNL